MRCSSLIALQAMRKSDKAEAQLMALFSRTPRRAAGIYPPPVDARVGRGGAAVPLCAADGADGVQLQRQQTQHRLARFHLKYYEKALEQSTSLIEALLNSLTIAALATLFSVILGTLAAVMLWRFRFPFKGAVEGAMALPIVVPGNLPGRGDAGLLRQDRLADRPDLAAQPVRDHHRPHHLLLPVRDDGGAQPPGQFQPGAGGSGQGSWAPANGRRSAMCCCRT